MKRMTARRWVVGLVAAAFLTLSWASAQQRGFAGGGVRGPVGFGGGHRIGFGLGHGFGFGRFGSFPRFGIGSFAHPFTFGFHQPFLNPFVFPSGLRFSGGSADPDGFNFFAGPASGGFAFGQNGFANSDPYGGWSFVERWKDTQPQSDQGSLSDSLLLREGMAGEDVMKALGSPLRRIELGQKEIWQYSGYSLLFEGGGLKEIR